MTFWELLVTPNPMVAWAAFFGTIVHLLNNKKKAKLEVLTVVATNYLCAVFMTELVSEISGWKFLPGISFTIAVGGMFYIEKFIGTLYAKITEKITDKNNGSSADSNL